MADTVSSRSSRSSVVKLASHWRHLSNFRNCPFRTSISFTAHVCALWSLSSVTCLPRRNTLMRRRSRLSFFRSLLTSGSSSIRLYTLSGRRLHPSTASESISDRRLASLLHSCRFLQSHAYMYVGNSSTHIVLDFFV